MLDQDLATSLGAALRGEALTPDDEGYEAARALYNGMIDLRPAVIARCADPADVIVAVNFGRENRLAVAIRGGGHNGAGFASVDGGLVIDLSAMRGVRVDPEARTVRVAGGCTWGDVDHATHAFGLAVPSGIFSTTGVAGLTLGGGHGYLSRRHGLTCDNLVEADVVLADGRFVTANAESHPELSWALRGGGGNFGVATSFVFRGHPATTVFGGPVAFDVAEAGTIMRRYRDWLPTADEDLCVFLGLKSVPSADPFPREHWGRRICLLMTCHNGPAAAGRAAMAGLFEGLPEPWFDWRSEMPYPAVQSLFDGVLPSGLQWYWQARLRPRAPRRRDRGAPRRGRPRPERALGDAPLPDRRRGAASPVRRDRLGLPRRDLVDGDRRDRPRSGEGSRAHGVGARLLAGGASFNPGGAYPNFMMDDEAPARLRATFGANYPRLAAAKRRYDPENFFRRNHNIPPA